MPWEARSLRLTVFPVPGSDLREAPNWEALVGRPPEETIQRAGQFTEKGLLEKGKVLQLAKQPPLRGDLFYGAVLDEDMANFQLPSLGPMESQLAVFAPFVETFLAGAPPLQRMAFGADLVTPQSSKDEAYRYLREAIRGANLRLDGASDFIYQINRPRESNVLRGVTINRLGKWTAVKWQVVLEQASHRALGNEEYGTNLTLDINTAAEFEGPIPEGNVQELFRELVTKGREIADRGDEA